jgi:hypothetical protein
VVAEIPFCYACAELHRAEARKRSTFRRWRSFIFSPVHIATIGFTIIFIKNVSLDFGRKRHIYSMRNKAFADAFIEANRDRVWTQEDQKRSSWRVLYQGIIFLGALIVARLLMWYYTGK